MEDLLAFVRLKALQVLRRHLGYSLRKEYIQTKDPAELWKQLRNHFCHEKTIFLSQACHDWMLLRVLDFHELSSFNSELHRIVAQLRLCGETLNEAKQISKTLSTFPLASAVLAQQYRNMKFCIHAKLMSFLLLAEKEHQVLVKNAKARLARFTSAVETHALETRRNKKKHPTSHQPHRQVPLQDKSYTPSAVSA